MKGVLCSELTESYSLPVLFKNRHDSPELRTKAGAIVVGPVNHKIFSNTLQKIRNSGSPA
jgi:hypothetical protein